MNPYITGIISTAIFLSGAWWQGIVFLKDGENDGKRHLAAFFLSSALILGSIGYTVFVAIDPEIHMSFWESTKFIGTALLIAVVFFVKQAFGPILLSATASWAAYNYLQHDVVELIPVVRWLTKWLFAGFKSNGSEVFLWLTYGYALIGSIYSTSID